MSLSARELIEAADKAPFMQWKARAKELIGENIPNTKGEILEELKLLAEVEPAPQPEPAPRPVGDGAVEVLLQRNYVPRYLLGEDGKFFDQQSSDGSRGHERISAGLAILHVSDAERVLADGRALPTPNTHRQIAKALA